MSDCGVRLVVRTVEGRGGAPVVAAPIITGAVYALEAVAPMIGASRKAIRNVLSKYPGRFDCRQYRCIVDEQGRVSKGRWPFRVLTDRDVATLRSMYRVLSRNFSRG